MSDMQKEAVAKLNDLRMSPRKVRLVADLIKGLEVQRAQAQLLASNKDAARPILKLMQSAVANAVHNHHLKAETLVVASTCVDGGKILYRWMPRAMGRATPVRKRSAHLTLVLRGEVDPAWKPEHSDNDDVITNEKTNEKLDSASSKSDSTASNFDSRT